MAKPLQGLIMSAVTNYISVSVLLASVRQCSSTSESDLNNCSDWRFLIFSGSRFHASGAETAKERSLKSVSVRTTTMSPQVAVVGKSEVAGVAVAWKSEVAGGGTVWKSEVAGVAARSGSGKSPGWRQSGSGKSPGSGSREERSRRGSSSREVGERS